MQLAQHLCEDVAYFKRFRQPLDTGAVRVVFFALFDPDYWTQLCYIEKFGLRGVVTEGLKYLLSYIEIIRYCVIQ